jgi:hypothetical protein
MQRFIISLVMRVPPVIISIARTSTLSLLERIEDE